MSSLATVTGTTTGSPSAMNSGHGAFSTGMGNSAHGAFSAGMGNSGHGAFSADSLLLKWSLIVDPLIPTPSPDSGEPEFCPVRFEDEVTGRDDKLEDSGIERFEDDSASRRGGIVDDDFTRRILSRGFGLILSRGSGLILSRGFKLGCFSIGLGMFTCRRISGITTGLDLKTAWIGPIAS